MNGTAVFSLKWFCNGIEIHYPKLQTGSAFLFLCIVKNRPLYFISIQVEDENKKLTKVIKYNNDRHERVDRKIHVIKDMSVELQKGFSLIDRN